MAHSCPECGYGCHCGGDIDDCLFEGTAEESGCTHCDLFEEFDEDLDLDVDDEENEDR